MKFSISYSSLFLVGEEYKKLNLSFFAIINIFSFGTNFFTNSFVVLIGFIISFQLISILGSIFSYSFLIINLLLLIGLLISFQFFSFFVGLPNNFILSLFILYSIFFTFPKILTSPFFSIIIWGFCSPEIWNSSISWFSNSISFFNEIKFRPEPWIFNESHEGLNKNISYSLFISKPLRHCSCKINFFFLILIISRPFNFWILFPFLFGWDVIIISSIFWKVIGDFFGLDNIINDCKCWHKLYFFGFLANIDRRPISCISNLDISSNFFLYIFSSSSFLIINLLISSNFLFFLGDSCFTVSINISFTGEGILILFQFFSSFIICTEREFLLYIFSFVDFCFVEIICNSWLSLSNTTLFMPFFIFNSYICLFLILRVFSACFKFCAKVFNSCSFIFKTLFNFIICDSYSFIILLYFSNSCSLFSSK